VKVAWLADAPTFGPLVRARAVALHPDVEGTVISCRADFEDLAAVASCISVSNQREGLVALAQLDPDVVVADWQWWRNAPRAIAGGVVRVGFAHREGTEWDLDLAPLHPWGAAPPRTTRTERTRPRVLTMSPRSQPGIIEAIAGPAIAAADVEHVIADERNGGVQMRDADLVVTSAGWSSSWEARWSGVPHFLCRTNDTDQWLRATDGSVAEMVTQAGVLRGWSPPAVPDHVPPFLDLLRLRSEHGR